LRAWASAPARSADSRPVDPQTIHPSFEFSRHAWHERNNPPGVLIDDKGVSDDPGTDLPNIRS
jgi:hypothetical protein